MDRRRWFGTQAAVWLVMVVAVISFLVGIQNIVQPTLTGPLSEYIPPSAQRGAGFTGAMTGFLLLAGAFALRRGLRVAWYLTMVLLPVTALQGVVQGGGPVSLTLTALSVLSIPVVAVHYHRFDEPWSLSTSQFAALGALVGAQIYGTAGTYALREEFSNVDTLLDAFYYTLVTASTVGYGDISAVSQIGRLFSMSVLVVGVASFGLAAGTLLGPAIEARFAAALGTMTESELNMLEDHVVVLGYGDLTEPIIEELQDLDVPFVVVTPDTDRTATLREREITTVTANPSDEAPLHSVGVERASGVVVATNDDAQDALAILTARELNPEVHIVAAATARENVNKLRRAGADTVISPAVIGGHLIVQSALGRKGMENIADRISGDEGQ